MDKDIIISHLTFLCDKWKELVDYLEKEIKGLETENENLQNEIEARDDAFEDICNDWLNEPIGYNPPPAMKDGPFTLREIDRLKMEVDLWKMKFEEKDLDCKASINENKFIREQIQKLNFSINPKTVK